MNNYLSEIIELMKLNVPKVIMSHMSREWRFVQMIWSFGQYGRQGR